MQRLTMKGQSVPPTVDRIADERVLECCEVNTDLVRPAGLQSAGEQRAFGETLSHFVMCYGSLAGRHDRHRRALDRVPPDRRVDVSATTQHAVHESKVLATDGPRLKLPNELALRGLGLRDREESARVPVQSMHDSGARDGGELRRMVHECVGQCPVTISGAGMNDEPGWFVDHEQQLILVHDRERELLRFDRSVVKFRQWRDDQALPPEHAVLGGDGRATYGDAPGLDPRFETATRVLRHQTRERLVE